MKYREQTSYQSRLALLQDASKLYKEGKDRDLNSLEGLEGLMLESFRFARFIRKHCNALISEVRGAHRLGIVEALEDVEEIIDEPPEFCVPMYKEADALEVLSFSIFKVLKNKGEIKYCKHCDKFLDGVCKKHKLPSSVDTMWYCTGCRGYLTNPCEYHTESE